MILDTPDSPGSSSHQLFISCRFYYAFN